MRSKRILRFYFAADKLNAALDNLICKYALNRDSGGRGCLFYADKIVGVIAAKDALNELWLYLDNVIKKFNSCDERVLKFYSLSRCGVSALDPSVKRDIKRVVTRFNRKAEQGVVRLKCAVGLVNSYYALL